MKALTARQEDALREVAHLGSAQAASMLARLVGDVGVLVDVPRVLAANTWQLGWFLGGRDVRVWAALFDVHGEVEGQLWWVLEAEAARRLGQRLLVRPGGATPTSATADAALAEAANIVASSCLSSVGTMVHAAMVPSPPRLTEGPVDALVGEPSDAALYTALVAAFTATTAPSFGGWLLLLLDERRRDDILRRLAL